MLYFIRHGESEANIRHVFAGQRDDCVLTERGKEQAQAVGQNIKAQGIIIDHIITSPLKRAADTAALVAKELGFDAVYIVSDQRLAEYDMGLLTGQPQREITAQELISAPEAEHPTNFLDRIKASLKEYKLLPGNTLLVSHAGVGRMIETLKQGSSVNDFYDIPIYPNASIVTLDWI